MTKEAMIRVGINGALGKMGKIAIAAVSGSPDMTSVFKTDRGDDLRSAILDSAAEVVIDFTVPDAAYANTMTIIESGARPVIGTTGLKPDDLRSLGKVLEEKKLGGIVAPNFSLGALLMMKLSALAARYMKQCEIIEYHHEKKIDSPSGTALMTAELLQEPLLEDRPMPPQPQATTEPSSRGMKQGPVTIHSVRLSGYLAHQQVLFGGLGESLTLTHNIVSRESFIPGIVRAIRDVLQIEGLQEGIEI